MPIRIKYHESNLSMLGYGKAILPQPTMVLTLLLRPEDAPHTNLGEQDITFSSWYHLLYVKGFYVARDSDMWI